MKRYVCYINMIIILFVSWNSFSLEIQPKVVFLGLYEGQVVGIDLDSWEVFYYDTQLSSTWMTYDIRYFSENKKIIFATGEMDYHIGVIDVLTGEVNYTWPDIDGLGNKIISYMFNTSEENKILVQFANRSWPLVLENEVEEFRKSIILTSYEIEKNTWEKIEIEGWTNIIKYEFTKIPVSKNNHIYNKRELLQKLIQQKVLENDAELSDIFLTEIIGDVQVDCDYFMCRKKDKLIVVKIEEDSFRIVNESPGGFHKDDERILKPNSVYFVFEPINFNLD